jgi:uncharacterized membrane protein YjfL (UPF0719 family)
MRHLILFAPFLPSFAFAAPRTIAELSEKLVGLLNAGVALLISLALVAFFGSVLFQMTHLEKSSDHLRKMLLWGVLAIFVMVSVWGIVALLQNTLFPGVRLR